MCMIFLGYIRTKNKEPNDLCIMFKQLKGIAFVLLGFIIVYKFTCKFQDISEGEKSLTSRIKDIERKIKDFKVETGRNADLESTFSTFSSWVTLYNTNETDKYSMKDKRILMTHPKCEHAYYLVILVQSEPFHVNKRAAIRRTWGRLQNVQQPMWKTFFFFTKLIGIESVLIKNEIETYRDIIYLDTSDEPNEITLNTIMAFKWSAMHCTFQYVLKVTDNGFVNIQPLIAFLNDSRTPDRELYAGHVHYHSLVDRKGKFGISELEYPKTHFARYCSGRGYVLSSDVVKKMISNLNKVKPFKVDDAFIGELAMISGVDAYQNDNFLINEDPKRCKCKTITIVHSPVGGVSCMEELYKNVG